MFKVLRDTKWSEQDASILVPGDVISIKLGDIVPADARLLDGDPLKIDQSALTGECLPVNKNASDEVFSGSTCKQGEIEAVVMATGVHTFFGKAVHLVDSTNVGHFQKVHCSLTDHDEKSLKLHYPTISSKYKCNFDGQKHRHERFLLEIYLCLCCYCGAPRFGVTNLGATNNLKQYKSTIYKSK